jgi:hypothetical protein
MNPDTIPPPTLPTLTTDLLACPGSQVDNLFSKMWQKLNFNMLLVQSGFKKRSGTPASDVVYLLMLWV